MVENRFVMKLFGILLMVVPFFIFVQNINFNLIIPIFAFFIISLITWRIDNFLTLLVWAILGIALFSNAESIISTAIFPIVLGAIWLFVIYRYMTWLKHMEKINKTFTLKGKTISVSIHFPWLILVMGIINVVLAFLSLFSPIFYLFVIIFFIGILFFKEHAYLSGSLMILFSLFVAISEALPGMFGLSEVFSSLGESISFLTDFATTIETALGGLIYFLILLTIGILCFKFGGKFLDKLFGFLIILVSLTFFTFLGDYIPFYSYLIVDLSIFEISRQIFLFFVGLIFLLEGTEAGKYDVGDKFGRAFSSIDVDTKKRNEQEKEIQKRTRQEQEEEAEEIEKSHREAMAMAIAEQKELQREDRQHQRQIELLKEQERLKKVAEKKAEEERLREELTRR